MNPKIQNTIFGIIICIALFSFCAYIYATAPLFSHTPAAVQNQHTIMPSDAFVITFDTPIDTRYYINNISITPRTPMTATINQEHTQMTITPTRAWNVNTTYTVSLPEGRGEKNMLQRIAPHTFHFTTPPYPQMIHSMPQDGETDVRLDDEDIVVEFDTSTDGFDCDFVIQPDVSVHAQPNAQKTRYTLALDHPLRDKETYTITVRAKAHGAKDDTYHTITTVTFTTRATKPQTWAQNLEQRVAQAKKYTRPRITEGKYIDINLSTQIMTIFENRTLLDAFVVSSGRSGMNTPAGTYRIYNKSMRPWSKKYHLYMPYWMAITPDGKYGIHELPEWPSGYKEGQNHLGIPVSHGCVRLGVGAAEKVFNWADIGTPIVTHYE